MAAPVQEDTGDVDDLVRLVLSTFPKRETAVAQDHIQAKSSLTSGRIIYTTYLNSPRLMPIFSSLFFLCSWT